MALNTTSKYDVIQPKYKMKLINQTAQAEVLYSAQRKDMTAFLKIRNANLKATAGRYV
jgi:hypothetical protein